MRSAAKGIEEVSRIRTGISLEHYNKRQKGQCRWCLGPVEPPRRTFCSSACVDEWKLRTDVKFRRSCVFNRDKGVCGDCGRECHALEASLLRMLYENTSALDAELARLGMTRRIFSGPKEHLPADVQRALDKLAGVARDPSLEAWTPGKSLWEADHILEVADGGGSCSLSNLQTLCLWCHRKKSAESRRRRAEARKTAVPPDDLFVVRHDYPSDDLFDM